MTLSLASDQFTRVVQFEKDELTTSKAGFKD
jgi:hypothetical protein